MSDKYWDKQATHYDNGVQEHDESYEETIQSIVSWLDNSSTVLDFGCASGEQSLSIAPYVKQVHGVDISAKMIDLASQKAQTRQIDNVRFEQIDVFDSQLITGSYSAVVAFNIFHLLPDTPKFLMRLNDLLSSGGVLISQTPCLGEKQLLYYLLLKPMQTLGVAPPLHKFTVSELESMIANNNFEIVESKIWSEKTAVQWIVARKR